jgi:hypothetical protein
VLRIRIRCLYDPWIRDGQKIKSRSGIRNEPGSTTLISWMHFAHSRRAREIASQVLVYRTSLLIECSNWQQGTTVWILTFTERVAAVLNYTNSPCRIFKKTRGLQTVTGETKKGRIHQSLRTTVIISAMKASLKVPYQENWTELKDDRFQNCYCFFVLFLHCYGTEISAG